MLNRNCTIHLSLVLIAAAVLMLGCGEPSTSSESAEGSKSDSPTVAQKSSQAPSDGDAKTDSHAKPDGDESQQPTARTPEKVDRPSVEDPPVDSPLGRISDDGPGPDQQPVADVAPAVEPDAPAKQPKPTSADDAEQKAQDDFEQAFSKSGNDKKDPLEAIDLEPTKIVRLPPPDEKRFAGLKQLHADYDVWFDAKNKRVVLQSEVCLRDGALELFACIHSWADDPGVKGRKYRRGTKEHESIVTINSTAMLVHTGLLLAGATNGSPASFRPKYTPAHGTEIEITLHWKDEQGKWQKARAQDWIRNHDTKKAMKHGWVFAGSRFWVDERTGERFYTAESGDLICVSNFDTAVLDLPIESSGANETLLFEAFTEKIPQVILGLTVVEPCGGGCQIAAVDDDSPASREGLMVGDVIKEAEFEKLSGLKQWERLLAIQRPAQRMLLKVERGGKLLEKRIMPDGVVVTVVLTPKPIEKAAEAAAKKEAK